MTCVICHDPVEAPRTGRPPRYCSPMCRRIAEYRIRQADRRVDRLTAERDRLFLEVRVRGTYARQGDRKRLRLLDGLIAEANQALVAILEGDPTDAS